MKKRKEVNSKKNSESKRPLMNDRFTQLSTMADFYAHASKNIIPDLYMKRIIKDIKARSPRLLEEISVTLAFHTDKHINDKNLKTILGSAGDGVNFECFLKSNKNQTYIDIGFNKYCEGEVLSKIKNEWSIYTDSGRRVFIFDFKTFDDMDKVFGLSSLADNKKTLLLKEVVSFEKMISEEGVAVPDYKTIKDGLSELFGSLYCEQRSFPSFDL